MLNSALAKELTVQIFILGQTCLPQHQKLDIFLVCLHNNTSDVLAGFFSRTGQNYGSFVLFMSYSTLDEVSKLVPNLEYLFSFNFELKNAETKFCFLGHLNAIKVP